MDRRLLEWHSSLLVGGGSPRPERPIYDLAGCLARDLRGRTPSVACLSREHHVVVGRAYSVL